MPEVRVAEHAGVGVTGQTRPTEDRVVVLDNAVAVLDGATHLMPGVPSGGWYAGVLADRLADLLGAEPGADLGEVLAEADPAAAEHASRASWPRGDTDALLIATDGVSCGVEDYALFDWPGMLALAREAGPEAVLAAVREAEAGDPDGTRWPRAKRHDDQALVLVDGL